MKDAGTKNPYTAMLHAMTGVGLAKPRKPQVFALWAKDNTEAIKNEQSRVAAGKHQAGSLNSIKSGLFKALPEEEQQAWEIKAQMEFKAAEKGIPEEAELPVFVRPSGHAEVHSTYFLGVELTSDDTQMSGPVAGCRPTLHQHGCQSHGMPCFLRVRRTKARRRGQIEHHLVRARFLCMPMLQTDI